MRKEAQSHTYGRKTNNFKPIRNKHSIQLWSHQYG